MKAKDWAWPARAGLAPCLLPLSVPSNDDALAVNHHAVEDRGVASIEHFSCVLKGAGGGQQKAAALLGGRRVGKADHTRCLSIAQDNQRRRFSYQHSFCKTARKGREEDQYRWKTAGRWKLESRSPAFTASSNIR